MNPLDLTFKGFAARGNGSQQYTLYDPKLKKEITFKGVWLEGSLIRLYDKGYPTYYIHDGFPQQNSGFRYIPTVNKVIPESVSVIKGF